MTTTVCENARFSGIVELELTGDNLDEALQAPTRVDVFVRMEEQFPGDPGQLSGTCLRVLDHGECATLNVEVDALQRNRRMGSHCLGWLNANEVAFLASAPDCASLSFDLRELYDREQDEDIFNGLSLSMRGGSDARMRVRFGRHSFGVLTGKLLADFLEVVRQRSAIRS